MNYPKYADYQGDALFVGLRQLFGSDVVDYPRAELLYKATFDENPDIRSTVYGRGFTLYGLLDSLDVDREDILGKIKAKYFDYVIYGAISRAMPYLFDVLDHYSSDRIVFVDGADGKHLLKQLIFRGRYFKRELVEYTPGVDPIGFGIPDQFVVDEIPEKKRIFSICDPRDKSTYIYKTQESYYQGYQEAFFGVTKVKAGWDCLRHYEILANGCIPHFMGIQDCPLLSLTHLPKLELMQGNVMADIARKLDSPPVLGEYHELASRLLSHTRKHLTTSAIARYLIDKVRNDS